MRRNGVHNTRRRNGPGFCCGLLALAAPGRRRRPLRAQESWSWVLPVKIYQNLDFSERAGIDRAREAYHRAEEAERRNTPVNELIPFYRGAAAEWKKVQLQNEMTASPALSAYLLFMQGLSLQGARDRNAAIKAYTELLDYFIDERWISTAALFHIGLAHQQNGDDRSAQKTYLELVEDPAHARHPLAARAYRRLGDMSWRAKKSARRSPYGARLPSTTRASRGDLQRGFATSAPGAGRYGRSHEYEDCLSGAFGRGRPQEARRLPCAARPDCCATACTISGPAGTDSTFPSAMGQRQRQWAQEIPVVLTPAARSSPPRTPVGSCRAQASGSGAVAKATGRQRVQTRSTSCCANQLDDAAKARPRATSPSSSAITRCSTRRAPCCHSSRTSSTTSG